MPSKKWQGISILVKMTQKKICMLKVKLNAIWMHATFGAKMFLSCSIDFCFCSIFLLIMNCKIEIWPAWVHYTKLLVLINMKRQKQIFCWLRYIDNAAGATVEIFMAWPRSRPSLMGSTGRIASFCAIRSLFIWIKTFNLTIILLQILM